MIDALLTLLTCAVGVLLIAGAFVAWWWETTGRCEHEREMWRREMRMKKPRR